MDQNAYRKLVSGESTGPVAALLRFLLVIGATIYGFIIGLRNFLYSKEWVKIHRADVPVISIGNITTGGTGKTPLVIRLCNLLISIPQFKLTSSQFAILTRGYKASKYSGGEPGGYGDEPAVLAQSCPGIQVVVNPDRIAGAAEAISRFGAKVLIMDDGFQHRRLGRDLDIVTIDATIPFGYGRLLPAGLLREPVTALNRADAAVITRCDQVCEAELIQLEAKLGQVNPEMVIARSVHAPVCSKSVDDREISLEELKNKRIFAFCGIGNPDAFFNTVAGLGAEIAGSKVFDDHYHYTNDCLAEIFEQAKGQDVDLILTTQKDWSSFLPLTTAKAGNNIIFAYLVIEFRFISGEDKITQLITNSLSCRI